MQAEAEESRGVVEEGDDIGCRPDNTGSAAGGGYSSSWNPKGVILE